jgi:hypothetical protein
MQNIIRIPLGGVLNADGFAAAIGSWDVSALTSVTNSQTTAALASTVTPSGGSGATFTFATSSGGVVSVAVTTSGSGYKDGDVISVVIPSGTINATGSDVTVTLSVESDMIDGGGNEGYISCPKDGILAFVIPDTSSPYDTWVIKQLQDEHARNWTIKIAGGTAGNYVDITKRINNVLIEALQKPNSHPLLVLPAGVTVSNLYLG